MQIEKIKIEEVQPDPANVRRHPERNLSTIKASLTKFGQQKPIVIDEKGIIIAGNGLFQAAKELGWTEVDVTRSVLKGSDATAYSIADNRSSELAEWDGGLAEVLAALQKEDYDLDAVGFNQEEIFELSLKQNPITLDDLLQEFNIENSIKNPIWVTMRTGDENKNIIETAIVGLKTKNVHIERSYSVEVETDR